MIKIKFFSDSIADMYWNEMSKKFENADEKTEITFANYKGNALKANLKNLLILDRDTLFKQEKDLKIYKECIENEGEIILENKALEIKYDKLSYEMRHKLITSLNVQVCPYCNRQYITSYYRNGTNTTTADLDHFYVKSKFPLFALSLFNFIPSCQVCNSRMKRSDFKDAVYPYEEGFDNDAVFKTEKDIICINQIPDIKDCKPVLEVVCNDKEKEKRIQNSIDLFNLDDVYAIHAQHVRDLYIKKRVYNEDYLKSLKNSLDGTGLENNLDEKDLRNFLFGDTLQKDEVKPLSKLTRDILDSWE